MPGRARGRCLITPHNINPINARSCVWQMPNHTTQHQSNQSNQIKPMQSNQINAIKSNQVFYINERNILRKKIK
jgi:hypothetical protein